MPYDKTRDRYPGDQTSNGFMIPEPHDPARNWYNLADSHIGAKELPVYGRSLRVRVTDAASTPVAFVLVPVGEMTDAATRTLNVDASEYVPYGVRRIVSINGGATVPAGVEVDVITE